MNNSKPRFALSSFISLLIGLAALLPVAIAMAKEESKAFTKISAQNEDSYLLGLIKNDPELRTHYNTCAESSDNIPSCLWERVSGPNGNEALKKKVLQAAEADKKQASNNRENGRAPSSEKDDGNKTKVDIVSKDNTLKIEKEKDPFIKKLQENISKQLEAVFTTTTNEVYKDSEGKVINQAASRTFLKTDHSQFSKIYNTHLSNSVVQSMATFCSEAKYDKTQDLFFLHKDTQKRKETLEKNTKDLATATFKQPHPNYQKFCIQIPNDTNAAEAEKNNARIECAKIDPCKSTDPQYQDDTSCRFNGCIARVSDLCYKTPDDIEDTDDKNYTQSRACEVMEFVKSARAAIMALEKQEKFYAQTEKGSAGITLKGQKEFQSEKDISRNAQDIVTITSKVAKDADEASKEEIESLNCLNQDGNAIQNEESCKKLLIASTKEDKEKAEMAVTELNLRRIAQSEKIGELSTVDELKAFLIAEGDSEEKASAYIEELTKEAQKDGRSVLDLLKEKIRNKYDAETKAIVLALADKVKESSLDGSENGNDKIQRFAAIQEELKSKGSRYTQMLHFGNVVSAYLQLTDSKTGKSSSNSNQLFRELASRTDLEAAKDIEKKAREAGLTESKEDASSTLLQVEQINDVILRKND